jgi:hypothetical protein
VDENDSAAASTKATYQAVSKIRYSPGVNTKQVMPKCSRLPPITSGLMMVLNFSFKPTVNSISNTPRWAVWPHTSVGPAETLKPGNAVSALSAKTAARYPTRGGKWTALTSRPRPNAKDIQIAFGMTGSFRKNG